MDAKSLARSKRAHSLHHSKKPHSNPKSKPSADRSTDAGKKAADKPVRDTPRNSLLSNWDRYEEEFDPDELPGNSNRQLSEVPLPKSKGGDYRQLIDEAKSQPFSPSDPFLDTFPTVHDLFPEFYSSGGISLLSAQVDGIVQSVNDESFIVEDKGAHSYETPLLSLNLNALAEQLSKIDVAKRLFIEADLLPPPELQVESTSTASNNNTNAELQKGKFEAVSDQLNNFDFDEFGFIKEDNAKMNQLTTEATVESGKQAASSATFKAATAEAELDALLNSFGETKLHDIDIPIEDTSDQILLGQGPGSSELSLAPPPISTVHIDVLLDDLLEETSRIGNDKGHQVSNRVGSSAPPTNSRSDLLNDFDSWLDTI